MQHCRECGQELLTPLSRLRGTCDECFALRSEVEDQEFARCVTCGGLFPRGGYPYDDFECDDCEATALLTPGTTNHSCWMCGSSLDRPYEQLRGACDFCMEQIDFEELDLERRRGEAHRAVVEKVAAQRAHADRRRKWDDAVGWVMTFALIAAGFVWFFLLPGGARHRDAPAVEPTLTPQEENELVARLDAGLLDGVEHTAERERAIDLACNGEVISEERRTCYVHYGRPENYDQLDTVDREADLPNDTGCVPAWGC